MRIWAPFLVAVVATSACSCGAKKSPFVDDAGVGDSSVAIGDATMLAPRDGSEADGGEGTHSYGVNGPDTVSSSTIMVVDGATTFSVTGYIPSSAGPHPVVFLSAGLEQPGAAYATYGNRLASWGIIALLRDDPGVTTATATIVDQLSYVVGTWLPAQNTASGSPLFGLIDTTKIALAGHSRGGEISLLAAESGIKGMVKAMFGLDPVDGTSGTVAITSIGTIGIPLAFIGETTDNGASGCAPAADNFLALYGAATTPAVAITAINADHTMFEDPASCAFCFLCTAGTATQTVVESEAVRYMMAFFARELLGDATVGAAFQGAGIGADVTAGLVTVVSK
jgi:Chlorophyllase enzyme